LINDTNFLSGYGIFDPDRLGPLVEYDRLFLMNISSVVPEPRVLWLLLLADGMLRKSHPDTKARGAA
jgi:hypothetical protein